MKRLFNKIRYYHSVDPHDGALQMALDELLLKQAEGVVLRDYCWSSPCVSIGYFGISSEASTNCADGVSTSLVRRPTGGGLVEHGHGLDYTYSIIISAAVARQLNLAPQHSYRSIHGVLAQVLQHFGIPAELAGDSEQGAGGQACFANPVDDDLMLVGKKVAGAGQKRSRGAILHQGSVQPLQLPPEFGREFAASLADEVLAAELDAELFAEAERLAAEKYRSETWNRRR